MADDPQPQSGADALIQALSEEGRVESAGAFTVDASRARELLESFRLADPHTFVVPLLQTAVLAGATRLEAEITRSRVVLIFDGAPLDFADLDQAEGALLTQGDAPGQRLRQALAEGLLGAEALSPSLVTVVSGGPEGGVALERRPGQPQRVDRRADAPPGTCITVERRADPPADAAAGWEPPEVDRLIRDGRFAPLTLEVNRRRVTEGFALPEARFGAPIAAEGLAGLAGIEEEPHPATWLVVQHGAVVAEAPLEAAPAGFLAVIQAPRVRRDLGLAQAVQDEAWREAKRAAEAGRHAVLEQARRVMAYDRDRRSREELAAARRAIRTAYLAGAFPEEQLIQDLTVWPVIGRTPADDHVSLVAVRTLARRTIGLCYLTLDVEALPAPERRVLRRRRGILHLESEQEGQRLGARLGAKVECLDGVLPSSMPSAGESLLRRLWDLVGLIGVVLTLALIATPVVTGHYYRVLRDEMTWPGVNIRVLDGEVVEKKIKHNKRTDTVYRVSVKYAYQFRGKPYVRRDAELEDHDSKAEAQAHLTRLRGPGYRVFVDPRDPTRVLHRRTHPQVAVFVGGGVALGLLGLLLFWVWHTLRIRRAEAQAAVDASEKQLDEQMSRRTVQVRPKRKRRRR